MAQPSNNKTQRLQQWFDERPRWDHASYGEFMHIGANQTIFRIALEEQEITSETKVLDTACAVGGNARWMASLFGCQVYGNDIDEDALAVARDLAEIENISELCTFVEAPVEKLPFEDGMFDIVVTTDIFDAAEVKRVLKPGGSFIAISLFEDPKVTPLQLAEAWGLELETSLDVTDLAFAFNRAKETEARLLHESDLIAARELIEIMNKSIAPYTRGGRHYIMRLRKK
ncbi:MAG: class I SAM-dependent methyltransferase [Chloroflexi bacterium]|jgi:ubiquinone/menaquinone biosynthesis C-methylase UbiE|nr:class I SAM-dependent methyltransferase [Chloroflexota bacterium]MBT5627269.1 class I SAM-dependent methyltransferase [Chloroflexota bacterium]